MTNQPQQPNPMQSNYYPDDEIELIDYLRVLWKWKWLIVMGTFLCAFVAFIYGFTHPAVKVSTFIEINPKVTGSPDKIKSSIELGIFDVQIMKDLSSSPPNIESLAFEVSVLNSLNILHIVYKTPDLDVGKAVLDSLVKQIEELYKKRVEQTRSEIDDIVKTKERAISDSLKLSDKESRKLSTQVRELLWNGNINGIADFVMEKLTGKRKAPKAALKKLNEYFGDHSRFQYKTFRDNGLPTGSGTVESAIRRVINLHIKGSGLFWKREHAENIIFLRSLVLTGKLKNACRKGLGVVVRNMFDNNTIGDLSLAA